MKKSLILFLLMAAGTISLSAQELRCRVGVTSQQVQGSNREVYETMRKEIYEFINNTKWTDHVFKDEERIECSMTFNIQDRISSDEFRGTLQVQVRRPVYGSSYTTTLFNHMDKDIQFRYVEFESLIFNEQAHTSNLVSIIAYYVHLILGMDYDTFSPEGGTLFYQKAEMIVNNAQNAAETGWKAFEGNSNRYWLIENLLNEKYSAYRSCQYRYHRMGLDRMTEFVDEARSEIAESIIELRPAYRENSLAMIWQIFFNAKADEIVNIFTEAFPDEKSRVVQVLKEISPSNSSKWDRINQGSGI